MKKQYAIENASLVRILTDAENRIPEGAGVLIDDCHVLTCAHVVGAVVDRLGDDVYIDFPLLKNGGPLRASVKRYNRPEEKPEYGQAEDICVLEILDRMPPDAEPAFFVSGDQDLRKQKVNLCGFPTGQESGDWVGGKLLGETAEGWFQLNHELESRTVDRGFSGTPVWMEADGKVGGIIVARTVRDDKPAGYMIPNAILSKVWPQIDPEEVSTEHREGLSPLLAKKCNRDVEVHRFQTFLKENQGQCRRIPQVFVLPGAVGAQHTSLIQRLYYSSRFRKWVCKEIDDPSAVPHFVEVDWPFDGGPEVRRDILYDTLFRGLWNDYEGDFSSDEFADFCREKRMHTYGAVIIVHKIKTGTWDRHAPDVLADYLGQFWANVPCETDMPLFLIFLTLEYPCPGTSGYWWWRLFRKGGMIRSIRNTIASLAESCICLGFDDLKPVKPEHVESWLIRQRIKALAEKEVEEGMEQVFKGRKRAPMKDVEECLENVIENINRKLSGLHTEGEMAE